MSEPLRFLLDEDLSPSIADQLRRRVIDAVSVHDVGRAGSGISDPSQFANAQEQRRVYVTRDRHYIEIANAHSARFGVITAGGWMSIGQVVDHLELRAGAGTWDDVLTKVVFAFD